jgi:hypothetical protein
MQDKQRKKVLTAFQLVLRPIVKILLRYGIGFNEFAESVKTVYVDVGSTDFGIRGRPTNISRVAVMTGLTRKEVRRLRTNLEDGDVGVTVRTTPISEIVSRWHAEDDFLDRQGRPLVLPFSGSTISFSELVKKFGGDVPPGAMRTELKRMNMVDEQADGSLAVKSRFGIPADDSDNLVTSLVHSVYPLLSTIARNTDVERTAESGCAQFSTFSTSISELNRQRLKRICYDRLAEAAVSFDDLFSAHELVSEAEVCDDTSPVVSVGLFYFDENDPHARYKW